MGGKLSLLSSDAKENEEATGEDEEGTKQTDPNTLRALRALKCSAAKAPEYTVWSLTDLGVSYRTIGEIGVAREKFEAALALDPRNVRTLQHYGCFLHTACADYNGAAQMYEKALKINPIHILTLCCYADLLSASINPLRNDDRADKMIAEAASKATDDNERAHVAFARKNIQAARQRERDAQAAREEYKNRVEQDYIAYNLAKSAKGKKKKKR